MSRYKETIWCDGCGVEVLWAPVGSLEGNREHCCEDCLYGQTCRCGERAELDERRRAGSEEAALTSEAGDV